MSPALPQGSTILVTGTNGFIGAHVTEHLLAAGYAVKGTVRSADKGESMKAIFSKRQPGSTFNYIVADNTASSQEWESMMSGCAGVAHIASDLSMNADPHAVITPMVEFTKVVLRAAKHAGVKRFVYTSSATALAMPAPETKFSLDDKSWNDAGVKMAWEEPHTAEKWYTVYGASKTEGERAAWKFIEEEKPGFVLNTVCPDTVFGEIFTERGSTAEFTRQMWKDPFDKSTMIWQMPAQWCVDAADVARLHVAGLVDEQVKGQRLLGYAHRFNVNSFLDEFKKMDPQKSLPEIPPQPRDISTVDTENTVQALKRMGRSGWTPFEETVRNNVMLSA